MKIELILNDESASFFYNLKNKHNELVIPVEKWNLFIKCNCEIKNDNIPSYITCGEYVITEREWFDYIVRESGRTHECLVFERYG